MTNYIQVNTQNNFKVKEPNDDMNISESEIEQCAIDRFPLMVFFMKASFMWPYSKGTKKRKISVLTTSLCVILLLGTIARLIKEINKDKLDINTIAEGFLQFLVFSFNIYAIHMFIFAKEGSATVKNMCETLVTNWVQSSPEEQDFLQTYVAASNFINNIATVLICVSYTSYVAGPVLGPLAANQFLPGNQTYPRKMSINFEFFIDEDKYFYFLFAYVMAVVIIMQIAESCMTCMYISSCYLAIGKFDYLGFKLQQISNLEEQDENYVYNSIANLVRLHQLCINYVEVLNKVANDLYFVGVFSVIIGSSIAGCLMVNQYKNDINFAINMGFSYVMSMQFLFIGSYPSQRIYSSSSDIYNKCYSTEWYKYSLKTRKLLQLMMMRALEPSCTKIGPTHPLNFESSGKIIRLSLSYITALISIMNLN